VLQTTGLHSEKLSKKLTKDSPGAKHDQENERTRGSRTFCLLKRLSEHNKEEKREIPVVSKDNTQKHNSEECGESGKLPQELWNKGGGGRGFSYGKRNLWRKVEDGRTKKRVRKLSTAQNSPWRKTTVAGITSRGVKGERVWQLSRMGVRNA